MRIAKEEMAILLPSGLSYYNANEDAALAAAAARRDSGRSLGRAILAAIRYVADMPRRRAVTNELMGLSDRELADIGIARDDVPHVCNRSFAAARHRLAHRAG